MLGWPHGLAILSVLAGLGLLVTATALWFREREARQIRIASRESDLARVDKLVGQAVTQLAERDRLLTDAARRAATDQATIRARLAGDTGDPAPVE